MFLLAYEVTYSSTITRLAEAIEKKDRNEQIITAEREEHAAFRMKMIAADVENTERSDAEIARYTHTTNSSFHLSSHTQPRP